MGNIGRSSTGCYLCRKRKIKCDENKPGCKKCASIRKPCPGYPFSVELDIRTATSLPLPASLTTARPAVLTHSLSESRVPQIPSLSNVPPPPPPTIEILQLTEADSDASLDPESEVARSSSVKLEGPSLERRLSLVPAYQAPSPPPKYDVQHQSTCFFLNLFCWQASQMYGAPILDYLPEMLLQSSSDSCLSLATKAVSRMTLADRYSGHDARLQTGKEYVKALSATKATIRDSSQAIKDDTFLAVWMLGLYENINSVVSHGRIDRQHRTPEEEYQSHVSHLRGAMNLLRLRGSSQFDKARGEKIYRIFKATIQMRLFNLNTVVSEDFKDLECNVYEDDFEFIPSKSAIKATHYFRTAAQLLEDAKFALRKHKQLPESQDVIEELGSILEQCEALDAGMTGWSKYEDEPGWDIMRVQANTQQSMWALYPSHAMYFFCNFWVFLYWLRFFIARVKLFEGMIIVTQHLQRASADQTSIDTSTVTSTARRPLTDRFDFKIQQYRTVIQLTAGQLIGLTAYALGDVTNAGTFYSSNTTAEDLTPGFREVNVIGGLQLVIPLKVLQKSDSPTPTQKGAIDLALSHIGDGFRRQPMLI